MEKNYDAIDLMKFIAAIFIIGIHSAALTDVSPLLNTVIFQWIGRLALPLFFVASGFLLSKKIKKSNDSIENVVKDYVRRIGTLYIFWLVFNWRWVWDSWFANTDNSFMGNVIHFFIGIIFQSTFSGSWYLTSCIFSAILYFWVLRKYSVKSKLFITGLIFLAVSTFSLNLNIGIIHFMKNVMYLPVSIFVGPIYFAIGDLIAKDDVRIIKENKEIYKLGLGVSVLLWIGELIVKRDILISTDQLFAYPILSYFIFSLILIADIHISFAYELRKISSVMYLSQFSFIFLNRGFLSAYNLSPTFFFLLTSIQTIIFGLIILKLQKAQNFKWLEYAY